MRRYRRWFGVLLCSTGVVVHWAQAQLLVRGRVLDARERTPLPGATVQLLSLPDTARRWGAVANPRGEFQIALPEPGRYRLRISLVGYRTLERPLQVRQSLDLGELLMESLPIQTGEVTVEAVQERAQVKQDTVEYAASAYKVNPDATAEELVRKLPGVSVQQGQLTAHGETVRRVLVDGREFFGQDPMAVLRTLPAEMVQSVQIFDREGEQARLTGVRDPSSVEKTINIITNPAMRTGRFGRLYGGYGSNSRYQSGGTLNFFRDTLRMSLVGLSNNINQQNFALDDILGVVNFAGQVSSGGPPPMVMRMLFQGGRFPGPPAGMRGRGGPFAQLQNFFVPEQSGINTTHALGLMYSNRWGNWLDLTASYVFNQLRNSAETQLWRQYFTVDSTGAALYREQSQSSGILNTHRLNLRAEWTPDSAITLLLTPRVVFQPSESSPQQWGWTLQSTGDTLASIRNRSATKAELLQGSIQLLLVRRFAPGRSLSAELEAEHQPQLQRSTQWVTRALDAHDTLPAMGNFGQRTSVDGRTTTFSAELRYSEPLDSLLTLQLLYRPGWEWGYSNREAWQLDSAGSDLLRIGALSSALRRNLFQQQLGISSQYSSSRLQWTARLDYQWGRLSAREQLGTPWEVERRFGYLVPFLMLQYNFSRMQNLRAVYRPFVTLPTATQLQAAVDNSNPLALSSGNPELRPGYTHMLFARYHQVELPSGSFLFAMLRLMYGQQYISTETIIASRDTVLGPALRLPPGAQYTRPVNLDGYWSARTFWVLGMPAPILRSTVTFNLTLDYTRTPAVVNGVRIASRALAPALGLGLSSNWSQEVDFNLSYTLSYNRVRSDAATLGNSAYVQHQANASITLLPWQRWVLATQLGYTNYNGLGGEADRPILLWNMALGYRFLEGNAAELRLAVTDLLGQNTGVSRSVSGQYIEDSLTQVLRRYVMLQFSYRLRNFQL
jgi:hypothetical protein